MLSIFICVKMRFASELDPVLRQEYVRCLALFLEIILIFGVDVWGRRKWNTGGV